ncbi:MAG: phosphate ABC transporter permease PstA [Spirochaetaceae bacterium]
MSTATTTPRGQAWAEREDNIRKEQRRGRVFSVFTLLATILGVVALAVLILYVVVDAIGWLDWEFLTSTPSRFAEQAGMYPAMLGSIYLIITVGVLSLPIGVFSALWLEEYAHKGLLKKVIELNIANLAGVPSIVYGLLGLGLFVSTLGMDFGTVAVGAFTLTLRSLPIVIVSSQEAIRAVPDSHRHASLALGATRWQMIRTVTLPEAIPGIMTGTILALANAMGETAPLIMIGAATSIFSAPSGLFSKFSAMPMQIFAWSDYPGQDFQHGVVPAAIVTLLVILLTLNGLAIFIRYRASKRKIA